MTPDELCDILQRWLQSDASAQAAAELLLRQAASTGKLPKRFMVAADNPACASLMDLFSTRHFKPAADGKRMALDVHRWSLQAGIEPQALLHTLADTLGQPLANRRQQQASRQSLLARLLEPALLSKEGLPAVIARRELEAIQRKRGRLWARTQSLSASQIEQEITRYWRLLAEVNNLLDKPDRMMRLVHLSRLAVGDSHYLRPGNQVCRDLAADLATHHAATDDESNTQQPSWDQTLADVGIVENLVSVNVLLFGRICLRHGTTTWRWPLEAAAARMPLWLSAAQLERITLSAESSIHQVICVENETSMLDLIEQHHDDPHLVLICTAGQANRAVVRLLRLLHEAFSQSQFKHQGDLDLPGVRILHSLRHRTDIDIEPFHMDAQTFSRYQASHGIILSHEELIAVSKALRDDALPCHDLLLAIHNAGKRIEQEAITHNLGE